MIEVRRGDLVWLKPGIEGVKSLGKNVQNMSRPYIVISNNKNNKYSPTIQLAAVSKQVSKSVYPMHVFLSKNNYDCLQHDSIVLLEQVVTVNKELVQRNALSLTKEDLKKVNKAIFMQMIDDRMNLKEVM